MTGGGFVVALDSCLYRRAATALVQLGAIETPDPPGDGMVQLTDDEGRRFTLYERVPPGTEWEVHDDSVTAADGVQLPDMQVVVGCPFVCRWADLAVHMARRIARTAEAPTWVLDGDGVLWDAENVDPTRLRL